MVGTALTRLHWCQRRLSRVANSCFVLEWIFVAVFIVLIIAYFTVHSETMNSLLIFLSVLSNWHFKSIFLWRIHSAWGLYLNLQSYSLSDCFDGGENTQPEKQQRLFALAWEPANGIYSEWRRDLHKRVLQFSTMGTFDAKFPSVCQSLSVSHFPSRLSLLFISISFVLSLSTNSLMSVFQLSPPFLKG